ncbi:unnamed protein product [Ilex paraguariensis]|uniref:Uncharacterized protein n=1 Tax=Ilex paraguariensis TaxID=185542 RepID=A0ABC8SGC7_9AQUA
MEPFLMLVFLFSLIALLFQLCHSTTIVVDGVSEWTNPTVQIGDIVIFHHKYHYNLYIFRNQGAFYLCNFTQATLLSKPNSTSFTWHPSRPGFFYFSFNNGSTKPCQQGHKLAVKVSLSPEQAPMTAPTPSSGGAASSSPAFPWPFRPRELTSPSPSPSVFLPAMGPMPPENGGGGGGIPFISSNPAVPLPSSEMDSATILPLPTSGHQEQVVGFVAVQRALGCLIFLVML